EGGTITNTGATLDKSKEMRQQKYKNYCKTPSNNLENDGKSRSNKYGGYQDQQIQEFENSQAKESIKHRKQDTLNMQITELGQIMADISLHISIQGESLSRIDDLVSRSDSVLDRTTHELKRTWRRVKNRRHAIFKFFIIWIFIIFIYWYLRR
ncbi:Integral membrane protein sed5, partial [Dictyocoela roeselum]